MEFAFIFVLAVIIPVGTDYGLWVQVCMTAEQMKIVEDWGKASSSGIYRQSLGSRIPFILVCVALFYLTIASKSFALAVVSMFAFIIYAAVSAWIFWKLLKRSDL